MQIFQILSHFLQLFAITNQPTMASQYKKEEDAIEKALHAYLERKHVNLRITLTEIAKEFNVSYHRLIRRNRGFLSRTTRPHTDLRLDNAQCDTLYQYLDYMMDMDLGVSADDIRNAANMILQTNHQDSTPPPKVSKQWPYNFMKQHPQYSKVKRHVIELNHAQAKDPIVIKQWYNFFALIFEAKKIHMNDIYNFDETGFLIGHGRSENALSKTPKKRHTIASQSSRIAVTAIKCISMTGYLLLSLPILPGKRQMSD
jgi:hypothetical protein